MDGITLLGLIAGFCTTIAFFPQFLKTLKTRSTKDVSLLMYIVLCMGLMLWLVYGILINSLPVIIANIVTFILAVAILVMKLKYK